MVRRVVEAEVLYERAALCRDRAAAAQAQQRLRHPAGTAQQPLRHSKGCRRAAEKASEACKAECGDEEGSPRGRRVRPATFQVGAMAYALKPIQEAELQNWASEDVV